MLMLNVQMNLNQQNKIRIVPTCSLKVEFDLRSC
jgi:hypothetical protein